MRSSRHPEQERIPTTRRGEDAPPQKSSAQMSSVEHFLSDYAPIDHTATPVAPGR
jgi:hypothetical protein